MRTYPDATVLCPVFDYLSTPETQMSDSDVDEVDDLMYEAAIASGVIIDEDEPSFPY